jgi:geranylgeranyl pyrophosphate synthase
VSTRTDRFPGAATAGADPARAVDAYLAGWIDARPLPAHLREAAAYAVLGPGKRVRPTLVIRSAEAVSGAAEAALAPAAAVELVHAFSLVHDDLPSLDDDDLRRGRPTLHRKAGEAMAVLAGDVLLGLAVELVAERVCPPERAHSIGRELIRACNDMIAGQVQDTVPRFPDGTPPRERLETIHRLKTAALIRASCRMGGLAAGAREMQLAALTGYGEALGLMFQVVDDLLDVTQTTAHLGKQAGKDAGRHKLTYPALVGIESSRREVARLRDEALAALESLGGPAEPLRRLARDLATRTR